MNQLFERWLEKEYHKYLHTGIGQTPMERYIQDFNSNPNAIDAIHSNSSGIPRIINALALKCLTLGALGKKEVLSEEDVYSAYKEL